MSDTILKKLEGAKAVLGLDMVGFTKMQEEEQLEAIQLVLKWIRQSLAYHGIADEQYRWSPAGDGGYLTFGPLSACRAAVDVALTICQKQKDAESPAKSGPIQLKFAVHAGTIVESSELGRESNVWGEGINTAERMLGICAPSQILISQPYYDLFVKGRNNCRFNVGTLHYRTVKHEIQVPVMNVNRDQIGLDDEQSRAVRWRAIGSEWQRTIREFQSLVHDCLRSMEAIPGIAAAKFLLNLGDRETCDKISRMLGRSDERPWPQYQPKQESFFGQMPPHILMRVIEEASPRLFAKGDIICKEGEPATSCFFPVSGTLAVEAVGVNKPISQGSIIGEFSLWIPNIRRTAQIRALDEGLLLEISNERLSKALSEAPEAVANDIFKIVKDRIIENVLGSAKLFPGLPDPVLKSAKSALHCEKYKAGSVLDLRGQAFILFNGKVAIRDDNDKEFTVQAPGRIGKETVIGLICDLGTIDGDNGEVREEVVVVRLPHEILLQWQSEFESIQAAWNGLYGERLGHIRRNRTVLSIETNKQAPTSPALIEEPSMTNKLRSLQARAIALNHTLTELREKGDDGSMDDGRYFKLSTKYRTDRVQLLLELKDALSGHGPELEDIVGDAIETNPLENPKGEEMLLDRMAQVAKANNLEESFVKKLNEHKGTVVSWLVEIGVALGKRLSL